MRRMAIVGLVSVALCTPGVAPAQDTTPKVDPSRIDDVPVQTETLPEAFRRFDNFSWRAFIALNWPALLGATNRGLPDTSKKPGDPGPRVWETYKARYEVFAPGAPKPAAWESYDGRNPCGDGVSNELKTLSAFNKFADFNQADTEINRIANPLVAQNRTYTRYEVRINKEQFDTIRDDNNKWYIFDRLPKREEPGRFKLGSIEIKAAWRLLNDRDTPAIRNRFYVVKDALVFDPVKSTAADKIVCDKQDIALVGFHIVIKTKERPQWIWSSFEHIDNVPPIGDPADREPDAKIAGMPYSYNDPSKPQSLGPQPAGITPTNPPSANPDPTQVVRRLKIRPETMALNREYWGVEGIKGTVWANYMLVMTQWPTKISPEEPANPGNPFPQGGSNVANTTMETYHQGTSCMACHQRVSNKDGRDFVAFMVVDATNPSIDALRSGIVAPAASSVTGGGAALDVRIPKKLDPSLEALREILREDMAR